MNFGKLSRSNFYFIISPTAPLLQDFDLKNLFFKDLAKFHQPTSLLGCLPSAFRHGIQIQGNWSSKKKILADDYLHTDQCNSAAKNLLKQSHIKEVLCLKIFIESGIISISFCVRFELVLQELYGEIIVLQCPNVICGRTDMKRKIQLNKQKSK